ncbi:unnamed protein product [Linum tenue]|uniref:Uncharacterized protein n=1 Tax=Linum tenue TaxID=586396 RepID=A0AAV0MII6_9ROSI|nr:unnamed protein product [Linum tenue]
MTATSPTPSPTTSPQPKVARGSVIASAPSVPERPWSRPRHSYGSPSAKPIPPRTESPSATSDCP